jgi:hypothetical protein
MRKISLWLVVLIFTVSLAHAQEQIQSPLFLFTNGSGQIFAFDKGRLVKNQELLNVGSKFLLFPYANPGYRFINWNPVNVYTITTYEIGIDGSTNEIDNIISDPQVQTVKTFILKSTIQPEETVTETSLLKIVVGQGWQANFAPDRKTPNTDR